MIRLLTILVTSVCVNDLQGVICGIRMDKESCWPQVSSRHMPGKKL